METKEILAVRLTTHGDFTDQATITQNIKFQMSVGRNWNSLSACQRESLEMIAHKIARILAGDSNFKDHWDDIAGYANLVADRVSTSMPMRTKVPADYSLAEVVHSNLPKAPPESRPASAPTLDHPR